MDHADSFSFNFFNSKIHRFLNEKSEDPEISKTKRTVTWIKNLPSNFLTGVSKLPPSWFFSSSIVIIANLIFKEFSGNTDLILKKIDPSYWHSLEKERIFNLSVKGPFLEELFFRECVQGSLVSILKIINLVGPRIALIPIKEETIHLSSRVL